MADDGQEDPEGFLFFPLFFFPPFGAINIWIWIHTFEYCSWSSLPGSSSEVSLSELR